MERISSLSEVCVRNLDGSIDVEATLLGVEEQLIELSRKEAESLGAISQAVHSVFDQHLGATIPMPFICTVAVLAMGVSPDEFDNTHKEVGLWVRNNSEFKVEGEGVVRLRDVPEKK